MSKPICAFCGKTQREVKCLIAGPTAYICNECVDLCRDMIEAEEEWKAKEKRNQNGN